MRGRGEENEAVKRADSCNMKYYLSDTIKMLCVGINVGVQQDILESLSLFFNIFTEEVLKSNPSNRIVCSEREYAVSTKRGEKEKHITREEAWKWTIWNRFFSFRFAVSARGKESQRHYDGCSSNVLAFMCRLFFPLKHNLCCLQTVCIIDSFSSRRHGTYRVSVGQARFSRVWMGKLNCYSHNVNKHGAIYGNYAVRCCAL